MASRQTDLAPPRDSRGAVLIPVKAFEHAKGRLASALDASTRESLAREMATHLVRAQRNVTVAICCDDESVAAWAESVGASVIWCPDTDLNGAVQVGLRSARDHGYTSVAVAHSDLPLAGSLDALLGWPGVTLVPDRHRTGSNVLTLPADLDFTFSYGQNSYLRHLAEGQRHGRGVRIVHDAQLSWDIDDPEDLDVPADSFLRPFLEAAATESEYVA